MRYGMKKPRALTVRRYASRLIDLNNNLVSFPGATLKYNISVTEIHEILLNSIPSSWYKQAYIQDFDCESITFKKAVNMFESMEIDESIYEGVIEPSYKNLLGHMQTVQVTAGKIEERPPCHGLVPRRLRALASAEKGT